MVLAFQIRVKCIQHQGGKTQKVIGIVIKVQNTGKRDVQGITNRAKMPGRQRSNKLRHWNE